MNKSEIEKQIKELDLQITALSEESRKLKLDLVHHNKAKYLARVETWKLDRNSCMVCFAKRSTGFHWCMIKTIKIQDIDKNSGYFDAVVASYNEADYDYFVKVENERIRFEKLEELESDFNLYLVNAIQLTLVQQKMCNLEFDYNDYNELEAMISKEASLCIKIN